MNKRTLMRHFSIAKLGFYRDEIFNMLVRDIKEGIQDNEMIVLAGEWGAGKSTLFNEVKKELCSDPGDQPILIRVCNEDRCQMRIGSILTAILLTDKINKGEPIRRDMEARSRQVVRLMGEKHVEDRKRIVLFIENAHELHVQTIRALKNFRENDFAGISPLFSIVLIGQPELTEKIRRYGEVRCRVSRYELNEQNGWMTYDRRREYIKTVFGNAITAKARDRIARLYTCPLGMDYYIWHKFSEAMNIGKKVLDADCFDMTPQEHYELLNQGEEKVSYRDISRISGISRSAISKVMHGQDPKHEQTVKNALKQIEEKRQNEKQHVEKRAATGE